MSQYAIHVPFKYWLCQAILYLMFVFLFILLVPTAVVELPWVISYTEYMTAIVPMLGEIQKIPEFNRYLGFYYSVFWVVIPALALGLVTFGTRHPNAKKNRSLRLTAPLLPILLSSAVFMLFVLMSLVWPVNVGTTSWRDQSLVRSGFGFAYFGLVSMWAWSLWFLAGFILLERLFFFFWNKTKSPGVNHV